jgi:hypothetical protein
VKWIRLASVLCCGLAVAFAQDSPDSIKTTPWVEGVTAFEAQWYSTSLRRMNEPRLPDFVKDANAEIYRLLILPTWGNSIVVRIQRHGEPYSLSARRLDGQAGYVPGKLAESKDIELNSDDSKALGILIQNLSFFQLPQDDKVDGSDGDEWIIEGVAHGKYHLAQRWCATDYNSDKRGLKTFVALCKFLIDKSTLSQRPQNKGHKLI